jgi:hypothetical protein
VYKYYSAVGVVGPIFCLGSNVLTEILMSWKVIDGMTLKLADVDLNFTATMYNENKGLKNNPGHALVRFKWLEFVVRIAIDKNFKSKICAS